MNEIKVNVAKKLIYIAINRTTGLSDLVLQPFDETGTAFGSPIAFTELANGAYEAAFTPDAIGTWRVRVTSVTNHDDAIKQFDVVSYDVADVYTIVDNIETKIDSIKTETDKIQTIDDNIDVIKTTTDAIKAETDKIQTIDNNVDSIKATVESSATDITDIKNSIFTGGYFA